MKKLIKEETEKKEIVYFLNKLKNKDCVRGKNYHSIESYLLDEKLNPNLASSLVWARYNDITIDIDVLNSWEKEKGILYQGSDFQYEVDCDFEYCRNNHTHNKLPIWQKWAEYLGTSINEISVDGSWYSFVLVDEDNNAKMYPADDIFDFVYEEINAQNQIKSTFIKEASIYKNVEDFKCSCSSEEHIETCAFCEEIELCKSTSKETFICDECFEKIIKIIEENKEKYEK